MRLSNFVISIIEKYSTDDLNNAEQSFSAFVRHVCKTFSFASTATKRAQKQLQEAKSRYHDIQQLAEHVNRDNSNELVQFDVGGAPLTLRAESLDDQMTYFGFLFESLRRDDEGKVFVDRDPAASLPLLNSIYRRFTPPKQWIAAADRATMREAKCVARVLYLQSDDQLSLYDFATGWGKLSAPGSVVSMCSDGAGAVFVGSIGQQGEMLVFEYIAGEWQKIRSEQLDWHEMYLVISSKTILLVTQQEEEEHEAYHFFTIDRESGDWKFRMSITELCWPNEIECIGQTFYWPFGVKLQRMNPVTYAWEDFASWPEDARKFYGHRNGRYIYVYSRAREQSECTFSMLDTTLVERQWQQLPDLINKLKSVHDCVVDSNDCLWIIGGWDGSKLTRGIQFLTPNDRQWRSIDIPKFNADNDQLELETTLIDATCLTYTNNRGDEEDVLYILEGVEKYITLHTYFIQRELWLQSEQCYTTNDDGYIHASL